MVRAFYSIAERVRLVSSTTLARPILARPHPVDPAVEPGAERLLLDAVHRQSRRPHGWAVVALHLSRLPPPGPRPHHRRIAHVLLHDVAKRHDGQVFGLRGGDIALLCRADALRQTNRGAKLPDILARLLHADAPDPSKIMSVWQLDRDGRAIAAYAASQLANVPQPADDARIPMATEAFDALAIGADTSNIAELGQRQIGVRISGSGIIPVFREISFSITALQARLAMDGAVDADPYLFRHLATRLDRTMLRLLAREHGSGSAMDLCGPGPLPHVNLTPRGILSPGFNRLAAACQAARARIGVEIALLDAIADPGAFAEARATLAHLNFDLIVDGVSHLGLRLCAPEALRADCIKLDWSTAILELSTPERATLENWLRAAGPVRILLQRADSEAALQWGLARNIRHFQGRHVDAMLGAARMLTCPQADGCTLGQCVERATAAGPGALRRACRNLKLLDRGLADQGIAA